MKSAINIRSAAIPSIVAVALLAVAGAGSGGRAQASEAGEPLTEKVAYGDLNLATEQGAKVLYVRLRYAAQDVCRPFEARELSRRRVWQKCIDQALSSAVEQINRPMVTAVHNQRSNHSSAG
jgi:UrcA family protein